MKLVQKKKKKEEPIGEAEVKLRKTGRIQWRLTGTKSFQMNMIKWFLKLLLSDFETITEV